MQRVLVLFPTMWDEASLLRLEPKWRAAGIELERAGPPDAECRWDFDVLGFIREVTERERGRGRVTGVLTSSDYPGAVVAAALADALDLPGPSADSVLRCAHKYYSRVAQRESVPEATPGFALAHHRSPLPATPVEYPCFVKPVKGAFSVMARQVNNPRELEKFLSSPEVAEYGEYYLHLFHRLLAEYPQFSVSGDHFLVEGLLTGEQVTVEGYAWNCEVEILGISDSGMIPGTRTFARFDYPSALPLDVQQRMEDIARRVMLAHGFDGSLFNIEMIYDRERDRVSIIEINPRICGQFADFYEKVDGVSGYEVAIALATGRAPPRPRRSGGRFRVATSFPLRLFAPARVVRAPTADEIRAIEEAMPGVDIWTECATGDVLKDFVAYEDGQSCRYAVINVGAADRDQAADLCRRAEKALDFRFAPIGDEP